MFGLFKKKKPSVRLDEGTEKQIKRSDAENKLVEKTLHLLRNQSVRWRVVGNSIYYGNNENYIMVFKWGIGSPIYLNEVSLAEEELKQIKSHYDRIFNNKMIEIIDKI